MRWTPSHGIPITSWSSTKSEWTGRPATIFFLLLGLWLFGTGEAILINAGIGVSPWTVLAQGVSFRTGISIGLATFFVSATVLALWFILRQRPGLGTVLNVIVVAIAVQTMILVVPIPSTLPWQIPQVVIGVATIGLGSGFYLTARLGPGPRDGLMTGIHNRTNWPVWVIRFGIEIIVLVIGWLLGGVVGLGTLIFALLIGPFVGYGLLIAGWLGRAHRYAETDERPEFEA